MDLEKQELKKSRQKEKIVIWGIAEESIPDRKTLDDFFKILKSDTMNVTRKNDAS